MPIRNSAKAVIIDNNRILLNKVILSHDFLSPDFPKGSVLYDLPGGGQHQYEPLTETLIREVKEETGYTVIPGDFIGVYEAINSESRTQGKRHFIMFFFMCRLSDAQQAEPTEIDDGMVCCDWVELEKARELPLLPKGLYKCIEKALNGGKVGYIT